MKMTMRVGWVVIATTVFALQGVHEVFGCYPNPEPPCTPAWTGWFITPGKEPEVKLQLKCPSWFETCIDVAEPGASGGPLTASVSWSTKNGEKQRQDPTHCANPWIQTAPLIVPQPTINWFAWNWSQGIIAEGSGTTASFMFAPLDQPDGVYVDFWAWAEINDPDLGKMTLWDWEGVGIQVWRNDLSVPHHTPPSEANFPMGYPVYNEIVSINYCYPLPGTTFFEERYSGEVSIVARDKFSFDVYYQSVCGGELERSRTYPSGWKYSFSFSVPVPGTPFSFDCSVSADPPTDSQRVVGEPKICKQRHHAWVYKREVKQINSATFTGYYHRYHVSCLGQVLVNINEYLCNADASAIINGPTYLGYATLTARTDCCPDQVPCP